ncbi:hypothetical protein SAMN05421578_10271 [Paenibacillus macquariensis]|uniref:Alpha/beta hydrolase n=1 Tax=Paenibacillus macquariensis TaxID=948756 RepID=A0ABY1JMD7_9BACL|nr:hypothetical protein SAMN05421578_10271 [Paenibacillus macquariensis]
MILYIPRPAKIQPPKAVPSETPIFEKETYRLFENSGASGPVPVILV